MKILIKEPNESGAGYPFTLAQWLTAEVKQSVTDSKLFEQDYGKDWTLTLFLMTNIRLKKPKVYQPKVRWKKEVCYINLVPYIGSRWAEPAAYRRPVRQWLDGIAAILRQCGFDASHFEKRIPMLLKQFCTDRSRIVAEWVEAPKSKPANPGKWRVPRDLPKRVKAGGGTWEDERFDPILVSVTSDVAHHGREIPLTWQVEFDPFDERLEAASQRIERRGIEADGHGWSAVIQKAFRRRFSGLAGELHDDSESSTCVLWVESERACKSLLCGRCSSKNEASPNTG